jgi:hypothetical protein
LKHNVCERVRKSQSTTISVLTTCKCFIIVSIPLSIDVKDSHSGVGT